MYRILEKGENYLKLKDDHKGYIAHVVRRSNTDYGMTNWFVQIENIAKPYDPYLVTAILTDREIENHYGVDPNTYYAIYRTDTGEYRETGFNTLRREDAYEAFLHFWCRQNKFWVRSTNSIHAPNFNEKYKAYRAEYLSTLGEKDEAFQEWVDEIKYSEEYMQELFKKTNHTLHNSPNKYRKDYGHKNVTKK